MMLSWTVPTRPFLCPWDVWQSTFIVAFIGKPFHRKGLEERERTANNQAENRDERGCGGCEWLEGEWVGSRAGPGWAGPERAPHLRGGAGRAECGLAGPGRAEPSGPRWGCLRRAAPAGPPRSRPALTSLRQAPPLRGAAGVADPEEVFHFLARAAAWDGPGGGGEQRGRRRSEPAVPGAAGSGARRGSSAATPPHRALSPPCSPCWRRERRGRSVSSSSKWAARWAGNLSPLLCATRFFPLQICSWSFLPCTPSPPCHAFALKNNCFRVKSENTSMGIKNPPNVTTLLNNNHVIQIWRW